MFVWFGVLGTVAQYIELNGLAPIWEYIHQYQILGVYCCQNVWCWHSLKRYYATKRSVKAHNGWSILGIQANMLYLLFFTMVYIILTTIEA